MNCQYCQVSKKCKICRNIYFEQDFDTEKLKDCLNKYGVAVIKNWISKPEEYKQDIIEWLINHSDNLTEDHATWIPRNMPYGPRKGMMQSLIGHAEPVWKIRELLYPIFRKLHGTKNLYTSMDGATVCPPVPPTRAVKDWPHIDQTTSEPWCIQGQAVLTTSSAAFRCTPRSSKEWEKVMEQCLVLENNSNWLKFSDRQILELQEMFKWWQMPIYVEAGSVILWNSKTIHSAQYHQSNVENDDWRCTVYVCMRPQDQFTKRQLTTLKRSVKECRTTNHWGTKMFGKRPGSFRGVHNRAEDLEMLSDCPEDIGSVLDDNPSKIIKRITVSD